MKGMAIPEPDLRILQANERTLLAWVRTGLTLMAFGFVVSRLAVWLQFDDPTRGPRPFSVWFGAVIIALGVACQALGAVRFRYARRAIIENRVHIPDSRGPIALALGVGAAGAVSMIYLAAVS